MKPGVVRLVGAGPGAADLVTVRAVRCLEEAEVIVYDRLVNHELLGYAKEDCELIYVGKRKHLHVMDQDSICQLLVDKAREGKQVVRLKGGDPFVFGRGGEEIDAMEQAGIEWQVVPGVTAASGAAASLGMPLTHRDESASLTLMTAHRREGLKVDWSLALHEDQTLVFYMALSCAHELISELLARGKDPGTPFTIVAGASTDNEHSASCVLRDASALLREQEFSSPAILVIGARPRRSSVTRGAATPPGRPARLFPGRSCGQGSV